MIVLRKAIIVILGFLAQQQAEMKDFKPLDEVTGTDTGIDRQASLMITNENQFGEVWREHKKIFNDPAGRNNVRVIEAQVPKVDFKKNVVFVYFAGQTQGIDGYDVVDVETKGKEAKITIKPSYFVNNEFANSYGMWVFPKPTKAVDLLLLVGMNNGKPVTRKVGHFEPPKVQKDSKTNGGSATGS